MNNIYINFSEMMTLRQIKTGCFVCVGLDPLPEKMPKHLNSQSPYQTALGMDVAIWMMGIVDATHPYAAMYKIQRAHWEALPSGAEALQVLTRYIKNRYPDIPVFLDAKRGDIGRTQARYRLAHLEIDGADGVNLSPYMGQDCLEFLVESSVNGNLNDPKSEHGLVSLCYTSNQSGRETQDVELADGRKYWEFIAETVLNWSSNLKTPECVGLVMAAAYEYPKSSGQIYSEHLKRCREIVGDKLWFLVPGVGTQLGYVAETVRAGWAGWGSMVISSSSDIIFASSGLDYQKAAAHKAKQLYLDIQTVLKEMGIEVMTVDQALIVEDDPIETLKNCQGYYESPKDQQGNYYIGPLVGYAKKYQNQDDIEKNMVGFIYLNFAKAEEYPAVRSWFAELIIEEMVYKGIKPNCILGAPMGGLFLATDIGRKLDCRTIFAEKIVTVAENKLSGVRESSALSVQRHSILPGDRVVIVEDVVNNFSSSQELIGLIEAAGAKVVAILAAFNRSGVSKIDHESNTIPVISTFNVQLDQYTQEDPKVIDLVVTGNLILKPKLEWEKLEAAMNSNKQFGAKTKMGPKKVKK